MRAQHSFGVALLLVSAATFAQSRPPVFQSLELQVPVAPSAVTIDGRPHLVYEVHLTNLRAADVAIERIALFDADREAAPIADLRDASLQGALGQPGATSQLPDNRLLAAGRRAVLYVWLPLDASARVPPRLAHRIELDVLRKTGRERLAMQSAPISVRTEAPVVLGPPLRGGPWVALQGPFEPFGHRRVLYTIDGRARIPARFAIDWIKLGSDHKTARGDTSKLANWHGYGEDVLAVASGTVAEARDDIS